MAIRAWLGKEQHPIPHRHDGHRAIGWCCLVLAWRVPRSSGRARSADLAPRHSVLPAWQAACARFGHYALVADEVTISRGDLIAVSRPAVTFPRAH